MCDIIVIIAPIKDKFKIVFRLQSISPATEYSFVNQLLNVWV